MFAYWIGEHQQGSMISDLYESRHAQKHSQFSATEFSPPRDPLQNSMVMIKSLVKDSAEGVLIESCKP